MCVRTPRPGETCFWFVFLFFGVSSPSVVPQDGPQLNRAWLQSQRSERDHIGNLQCNGGCWMAFHVDNRDVERLVLHVEATQMLRAPQLVKAW